MLIIIQLLVMVGEGKVHEKSVPIVVSESKPSAHVVTAVIYIPSY